MTLSPQQGIRAPLQSALVMGVGRCPLVLGECVQGRLEDGLHFLITSPIDLYSCAEFISDPALTEVLVEPAGYTKSLMAVLRYLEEENLPQRGLLRVQTPAKPGLGFGTSTGDITASLRAAAAAWGREISPETISRIAISIEPSDGSMYPGSVAYAHRYGKLLEQLGDLPAFRALGVVADEGVETVAFDLLRKDFQYAPRDLERLRNAWDMVREANRRNDLKLMAQACTTSAEINQQLLPNPFFSELRAVSGELGAEGCFVAHSGSLVALIFDPAKPDVEWAIERANRRLQSLGALGLFEVRNHDRESVLL